METVVWHCYHLDLSLDQFLSRNWAPADESDGGEDLLRVPLSFPVEALRLSSFLGCLVYGFPFPVVQITAGSLCWPLLLHPLMDRLDSGSIPCSLSHLYPHLAAPVFSP